MRSTCFVLLLLMARIVHSQAYTIKNLIFEGAGMRGLAYAGVVAELESSGIMNGVERVGGTSAGAITAMMISLGYSSEEIIEMLSETEFQKFNDGTIGAVSRMNKNFGWFQGEKFVRWVEGHLEKKTGDPDITLLELFEQGFLPIYVTSTCVNKQKLYVLSHETYPNMSVKDAIRASMSIPLYFQAVFIDEEGKTYENYQDREGLDILVDGGIVGNYPIFLFDSLSYTPDEQEIRTPNPYTLGFRIDSQEQIIKDSLSMGLTPHHIEDFRDYVTALYIFTLESLNRNELTRSDWMRTVSISSEGIGPMIKKFSNDEKQLLINSGRESTKKYLLENNHTR